MRTAIATALVAAVLPGVASAASDTPVSDDVIAKQRAALAESTTGAGFGPQSPRDIDTLGGANDRVFSEAPHFTQMNLCNIHFHKNAEHRGGDFTVYAGNGDGKGYKTGFKYSGALSDAEVKPVAAPVGVGEKGLLMPGDTIEVHFVHSTAQVQPGPTLGSCLADGVGNPQLRVEAVVAVVVNDPEATDFAELAQNGEVGGYHQALNLPDYLGAPVQYEGSTTGPSYNEKGSPFHVSWSVRPRVMKVDIASIDRWYQDNIYAENYAHGVRNLVTNPALLSKID